MTNFIVPSVSEVVKLKLSRDHSKRIRQGYPWVYDQWLVDRPAAKAGTRAFVKDKSGALLAFGMYDPASPIAVRVCAVEDERLDDKLIEMRMRNALKLRRTVISSNTTGYRLFNGEGDGLPGLVCDIYGSVAVIRLDGAGPSGFWNVSAIAEWLVSANIVQSVYLKPRSSDPAESGFIIGETTDLEVQFSENGLLFQADIIRGQKSGFFFDQRDNRQRFARYARGRNVLNLFGYTGGFSVYAGTAGAVHVTTVDLAKPAILSAAQNWQQNELPADKHVAVAIDAFEYLEQAKQAGKLWDLIVVDPPSFASAERHVEKGQQAYEKIFAAAVKVLSRDGIISFSSCSSHISPMMFYDICQAAFSSSRRRAKTIGVYGQPEDHPFPAACQELQYLKFITFSVS